MDEKQKDHKEKENKRASRDAPSFMQPRKPVLDRPLFENEDLPADVDDSPESVEAQKNPEGEGEEREAGETVKGEGVIKDEPDLPLEKESADSKDPLLSEPPYSPYFPHGVYEDAQAVEKFYGRGKPKEGEEPFEENSVKIKFLKRMKNLFFRKD